MFSMITDKPKRTKNLFDFPMKIKLAASFSALLFSSALSAENITFNVNSTLDEPDQTPNDGVCMSASGKCTLRAAVEEATSRFHSKGDSIFIFLENETYNLSHIGDRPNTIDPLVFECNSSCSIFVAGKGDTVIRLKDNGRGRLVYAGRNANSVFYNLTFKDGHMNVGRNAFNYPGGGGGGAMKISSGSKVTVSTVNFIDNTVERDNGGAIHNRGELTIFNTKFINNKFKTSSADDIGRGGAIYHNGSEMKLQGGTVFEKNKSQRGGAIYLTENALSRPGAAKLPSETLIQSNIEFIENETFPYRDQFGATTAYGGAIYDEGSRFAYADGEVSLTFRNNKSGFNASNGHSIYRKANNNGSFDAPGEMRFFSDDFRRDEAQCAGSQEGFFAPLISMPNGNNSCF